MASDFDRAVEQVPEEQRRLLEKMAEIGLVRSFRWQDGGGAAVRLTPSGGKFLALVKAIAAPEPCRRLARLLALDALAEEQIALGGFVAEE
ncbi:MAG: hypothetical protein IT577_23815 [Verrucomicrobiae bacterium]|nr:hypothetical protein [Verrucomicrobiae bacterium]